MRDLDRNGNSRTGSGKGWATYINVEVFLSIAAVSYHRLDSEYGCRRAEVGTVILKWWLLKRGQAGRPSSQESSDQVLFSLRGLENISLD